MKKNIIQSILLLLLSFSLAVVPLRAQSMLNVQFGIATSPVQPDYNLVVLANGSGHGPMGNNTYTYSAGLNPSYTTGPVTLSFTENTENGSPAAGGEQNRDAGIASGDPSPYADLYRSLTFTDRNDIRYQLTGLVPYATYSIQAWSYSRTASTAGTIYYRTFNSLTGNSIGASTYLGSITYPAGSAGQMTPTSLSSDSITFTVTANSAGAVIFGVSNIDSTNTIQSAYYPTINGFSVTPAQSLLNVQFGVATSPVQSGYNLVVLANGSGNGPMGNNTYTFTGLNPYYTTGTVTLSFTEEEEGQAPVAGGEANRDAGIASGDNSPYADLYRSFTFNTRNDIRLQLTGLIPYATYSIQAWSYERTWAGQTVYYRTFNSLLGNSIGASAYLGSVTFPTGSANQLTPTSLSSYSITLTVVANSAGTAIFGVSNIDSSNTIHSSTTPVINGFTVTPAQTKLVFAHYMVCDTTYGPTIAGFKQDILEAQANGIDGFALNCGGWSDTNGQYYKDRSTMLFEAAEELGTGFKLFFSADMSGGITDLSAAGIQDMIVSFANSPNYFYYQNRPVLSTWVGGTLGQSWWQTNVLSPLQAQGYDVYFVPNFPSSNDGDYNTVLAFVQSWLSQVDGMFCFGVSGTPDYNPPRGFLTCSENWATALHTNSATYIAPVSPQYWGDLNEYTMGGGRRYMEYSGGIGLAAQWASIINNAHPEWVELPTWNDPNEYTWWSPVDDMNLYVPGYHSVGFHKTHRGATAMQRYYINWYKTGVQPPILRDDVFYFYRTQSMNGVATNDPSGPVTQIYGNLQDDIYVTTMLTAPATLDVITGGVTKPYAVGAGIATNSVPFNTGTQVFQLWRGSTMLWQQTGAPVDATFPEYNYGYYTGSTLTTPLSDPTGLTVTATGSSSVSLAWNALTGAASYNVKRAVAFGGPYVTIKTGQATPSYTDSTVVSGTTYTYVVSAIDATGGAETNNSLKVDATVGTPPSPWSHQDIGTVGTVGSSSLTSGTFTVVGSGVGSGGTSDAFQFVSQPVTGNCTITARVVSVECENTVPGYNGGIAGIMIRNTNSPGDLYAGIIIVPGNALCYQWRTTFGTKVTAYGVYKGTPLGATPYWLRIVRSGTTYTEYRSPDGVTWTQLGSDGLTMNSSLMVGLTVASGVQGASCVATFDNVSITTP